MSSDDKISSRLNDVMASIICPIAGCWLIKEMDQWDVGDELDETQPCSQVRPPVVAVLQPRPSAIFGN
ncbi:hypothetical protein [Novipirellula artificiosorum]|uniref:hypothetical protein n=1 Tax=Novipirellula artificiosorum TaxID=2528016 RepID=UPI0018CD540A|nr:hypothetical protein [Novipirellula artificiosorum]